MGGCGHTHLQTLALLSVALHRKFLRKKRDGVEIEIRKLKYKGYNWLLNEGRGEGDNDLIDDGVSNLADQVSPLGADSEGLVRIADVCAVKHQLHDEQPLLVLAQALNGVFLP